MPVCENFPRIHGAGKALFTRPTSLCIGFPRATRESADSRLENSKRFAPCALRSLLHTVPRKSTRKIHVILVLHTAARWRVRRSINCGLMLTGFHFRLAVRIFAHPLRKSKRKIRSWKALARTQSRENELLESSIALQRLMISRESESVSGLSWERCRNARREKLLKILFL